MKAPPDNMKIVSFNSKVIKSMLNKDIVLDIILKVKHVRQFPKKFVKKKFVKIFVKKICQKKSSEKIVKKRNWILQNFQNLNKKKIYTVINILMIN